METFECQQEEQFYYFSSMLKTLYVFNAKLPCLCSSFSGVNQVFKKWGALKERETWLPEFGITPGGDSPQTRAFRWPDMGAEGTGVPLPEPQH